MLARISLLVAAFAVLAMGLVLLRLEKGFIERVGNIYETR